MKRIKRSHRIIALFLLLNFLPAVVPTNFLYASNNGPNAPEAASFEPVDTSDMVNLSTGDLSYVLPLMNVPSPEGGYPLALSYHAGIAMDQEASWVGLGWNLNPGTINRSVNGYPDDWEKGFDSEYFYDQGVTLNSWNASISYTGLTTVFSSVGVNVSYSDNRGFGGSVDLGYGLSESAGVGLSAGTNGVSVNASVGIKGGFSLGASLGTSGFGINGGYGWDPKLNGKGKLYNASGINLGVSSSWSGDVSANMSFSQGGQLKKNSLGINFSSSGVGVTGKIGGVGTGFSSFEQTSSMNDYTVKQSGFKIPVYIPTPEGVLSASFGKQKVEIFLDKLEMSQIYGPLSFEKLHDNNSSLYWNNSADFDKKPDVFEVKLQSDNSITKADQNNAVFPNYDSYRVTAQGLSGSMSPRIYGNGSLLGLEREVETEDEGVFDLNYELPASGTYKTITSINHKPEFHFDNEYSSSLIINSVDFDRSQANRGDIHEYTVNDYVKSSSERKIGGRFVQSFTNQELANGGFGITAPLKAYHNIDYGNSTLFESDGIGAYMITTPDGKTYHYALPVYNHEIVRKSYGMGDEPNNENDAYLEKKQIKKFATHWLLTAITGPDFVDENGDGMANGDDYGYWVSFDYGKWSDGYIWYGPHGEEYEVTDAENNTKTYQWGRKEIYYLDKVQTRTHTALFVKEERFDSNGKGLTHIDRNTRNSSSSLTFRSQSLLRLKEIILLKNEDAQGISKAQGSNLNVTPLPGTTDNISWASPRLADVLSGVVSGVAFNKQVNYSQIDGVLDRNDANWSNIRLKALKIVDFGGYTYELATGAPYTSNGVNGRLTLKHVNLKGKGGTQLVPSYKFEYNQGGYYLPHKDEWGYDKNNPTKWSLNKIVTPTGGEILVEYEEDTFVPTIDHDYDFSSTMQSNGTDVLVQTTTSVDGLNIQLGDQVYVSYKEVKNCNQEQPTTNDDGTQSGNLAADIEYYWYAGGATVTQIINPNQFKVALNDTRQTKNSYLLNKTCTEANETYNYITLKLLDNEYKSGIRVKKLKTTDGTNTYTMEYDYNIPGTDKTSGIVSYIPYVDYVDKEAPFGAELPAPLAMYAHVKTTSFGTDGTSNGFTRYKFKTLEPVTRFIDKISFGDALEFEHKSGLNLNNTTENVSVDIREWTIYDNLASLGQLLSISTFNNHGHRLSHTENTYASLGSQGMGEGKESFQSYKKVDYEDNNRKDKWLVNSSSRVSYASTIKSTKTYDGVYPNQVDYLEHDPITGAVIKTGRLDARDQYIIEEQFPAYTNYADMGSKATDLGNKNMLSQIAMSKTSLRQTDGTEKVISASIDTWHPEVYQTTQYVGPPSNQVPLTTDHQVWRKHRGYVWKGDLDGSGFYDGFTGTYDGFDWTLDASSQPTDWIMVSQINKYDPYSMILETQDVNGNMASTKMGDRDSKPIAVANVAYNEMHYSGAEYVNGSDFDGGIYAVGRTDEKAHTGKYAVKVNTQQGFRTSMSSYRPGKYKVSVWVSKSNHTNARINDGSGLKSFNGETVFADQWVMLNHYMQLDGTARTIYVSSASGYCYFDDFRIHPVYGGLSAYVYNEWDELTHTIGANNMAIQYEYDEAGRLISTSQEVADTDLLVGGFKEVGENIYGYARTAEESGTGPVIEPLHARVTYGSSSSQYQTFVGSATGGSGNYKFEWYLGIGNSSSNFSNSVYSTGPIFRYNVNGCEVKWVKLVVSDNQYGSLGTSNRTVRNNNPCDPSNPSGPQQ